MVWRFALFWIQSYFLGTSDLHTKGVNATFDGLCSWYSGQKCIIHKSLDMLSIVSGHWSATIIAINLATIRIKVFEGTQQTYSLYWFSCIGDESKMNAISMLNDKFDSYRQRLSYTLFTKPIYLLICFGYVRLDCLDTIQNVLLSSRWIAYRYIKIVWNWLNAQSSYNNIQKLNL